MPLELYHFWDSFCSFKVRLCLEEKGLQWSGHHVDLMRFENLRPDYLAINPKGLVPVLKHDAHLIPESSIINEFLDERYPQPALKPADPLERARMRLWVQVEEEELFTAVRPASLHLIMKQVFGRYAPDELDRILAAHPRPHLVPTLKKMFLDPPDPKAVDQSRTLLRATLKKMDASLGAGGPWLAGATYSLADIAAAPAVDRIEHLGMAELWEDLAAFKDWVERLTSRPAYQRAAPRADARMPKPLQLR
jgi:glutathione S-transferase